MSKKIIYPYRTWIACNGSFFVPWVEGTIYVTRRLVTIWRTKDEYDSEQEFFESRKYWYEIPMNSYVLITKLQGEFAKVIHGENIGWISRKESGVALDVVSVGR